MLTRHVTISFCDGGDIMFLICRITSCQHMFKKSCEFMGKSPVSHILPCLMAIVLVQVFNMSRDLIKPRD